MTLEQEKDFCLRARRAHERRHGQSTWIECSIHLHSNQVRVADHELGITTYWDIIWCCAVGGRSRIRFSKQYGERR